MHRFRAYGLELSSEILCPELPVGSGAPEVQIRYAPIPEHLPGASIRQICYEANDAASLYKLDGVARYLVEGSDRISVDPDLNADPESIRLFLLGPVLGTLLYRRGFVVVHASCVEVDGMGILFLGGTGMGKSSLAALCLMQGYRVLAEDFCVLRVPADQTRASAAVPSYPQLQLWPDTFGRLGWDSGRAELLRPHMEKRAVPIEDGYCEYEIPIRTIYRLERATSGDTITRLRESEKLIGFMRGVFHASIIQQLWGEQHFFARCIAILKHTAMYQLQMPLLTPAVSTAFLFDHVRGSLVQS